MKTGGTECAPPTPRTGVTVMFRKFCLNYKKQCNQSFFEVVFKTDQAILKTTLSLTTYSP